jgi:hypothetical protein
MIIGSILITILVYNLYIKKHKKEKEYTKREKIYIGVMIYMWVLTIVHQVFVLIYNL